MSVEATGHRWHGRRRRRGAVLLAVVQLVVAGLVPAADAALERSAVGEPAHVEALADGACGVHHDHLFCQLCRVLSLTGSTTSAPALAADGGPIRRVPFGADLLRVRDDALRFGALGSRAPPLA